MALDICSDCNASVSSKAKACPGCGRPMRYWTIGKVIATLILGIVVFTLVLWLVPRLILGFLLK